MDNRAVSIPAHQSQKQGDIPQFLVEAINTTNGKTYEEALEILGERARNDPAQTEILFELAKWFEGKGDILKAEQLFKKILEIDEHVEACNWLGYIYGKAGRTSESVEMLKRAVELAPEESALWNNLGRSLIQMDRIDEGIALLRKAVELEPENSKFHSNLLFRLHYLLEMDRQSLFEEHKNWGQKHAPISLARTCHDNTADPDRRLRIGYISPDFGSHVVSFHIEPLLDEHDRQQVEVYGYGNVERCDATTDRLRHKFDYYRNIWGISDRAAADIIENDKIDILVDLAGHTRDSRLLVLAYKPSPVQVTHLGYGDTTGMEAVDYILTDEYLTPAESEQYYIEKVFRLSEGTICYSGPNNSPNVAEAPVVKNGYITFGAFINNRRFNERVLETWSEILRLTGGSKILLGFSGGRDEMVREIYLKKFEKHGISRDRILIGGRKEYIDYLRQYSEVDIVLDTFPENGSTTNCDALWMGVPVVTLAGEHQVGRYGLSLLSRLGLEFFAAKTRHEYTVKAAALAKKPESLVKLRKTMRSRMSSSPMCNAKQFTVILESAYRDMWRKWCESKNKSL